MQPLGTTATRLCDDIYLAAFKDPLEPRITSDFDGTHNDFEAQMNALGQRLFCNGPRNYAAYLLKMLSSLSLEAPLLQPCKRHIYRDGIATCSHGKRCKHVYCRETEETGALRVGI